MIPLPWLCGFLRGLSTSLFMVVPHPVRGRVPNCKFTSQSSGQFTSLHVGRLQAVTSGLIWASRTSRGHSSCVLVGRCNMLMEEMLSTGSPSSISTTTLSPRQECIRQAAA